jgi:hypothetical protein
LNTTQTTINERLKFLLEHYNLSARNFGRAIGVPENNTQNYLGPKGSIPKADYLERVLRHFQSINPSWLLLGEGEPFTTILVESKGDIQIQSQNQKKNRGHIINHTGNGPAVYSLEDCQRERDQWKAAYDALEREVTLLKKTIQDKDHIISLYQSQNPK